MRLALGRRAENSEPKTAAMSARIIATFAQSDGLVSRESDGPMGYPPIAPLLDSDASERVSRHHSCFGT